jgi:hypothetical protein
MYSSDMKRMPFAGDTSWLLVTKRWRMKGRVDEYVEEGELTRTTCGIRLSIDINAVPETHWDSNSANVWKLCSGWPFFLRRWCCEHVTVLLLLLILGLRSMQ